MNISLFIGMLIGAIVGGFIMKINFPNEAVPQANKQVVQVDSISTIPINENIPVWRGNKCKMWAIGDTVFLESGGWYVDQRGNWK